MVAADREALEETLLGDLKDTEEIKDSGDWASKHSFDHAAVCDVIKSLEGFQFVESKKFKRDLSTLTEEGESVVELGSPEVRLFSAVPAEGNISREALQANFADVWTFGLRHALNNGWLQLQSNAVVRKVQEVIDEVRNHLIAIKDGKSLSAEVYKGLKTRKLIVQRTWIGFSVKKGPNYSPKRSRPATDLTRELLHSGAWKEQNFKDYNFEAQGLPTDGGHLHPLLKVRAQFRKIFLEMGFEEMPTNNFVESSFWNFDALFQPQQHPARDSHDTFFLKAPARTVKLPEDYLQRVKTMHESGGHDSIGYGYNWKRDEAEKNLLRTHTTAVSSRMLYKLAQDGFTPKRYFSIDRVFRNEAVDKTHLAEFHQIEGVVCDKGLTLGDLIGVLNDFFGRLGVTKLRFKPAYNPYTEPSMEIFSYHEILKKWVEVGNSGMFRPEMLLPMGLPADVKVIAWGLSLERPTMILYNIDNIRELFGHKVCCEIPAQVKVQKAEQVDLEKVKSNPICRVGLQ